ncbi:MAG: hypothetical protein ACOCVK_00670 [bacterium]
MRYNVKGDPVLREWTGLRQRPEEGRRRWFTDEDMDLIVWYTDDDDIRGFQLCYAKQTDQHAVSWFSDGTYSHARVDDGEAGSPLGAKETPILVQDGVLDASSIAEAFRRRAGNVDPEIRELVYTRVKGFPSR